MILVDTGAWFAAVTPSDPNHPHAAAFLASNRDPLVTSDSIIDETLTLLRARGEHRRALPLGERFFTGEVAEIVYLTEEDVQQAWETFRSCADKDWSFTDCASKVFCERLSIETAFAFDRHFKQFGNVAVVP